MSNNSTCTIACSLIVGKPRERYLPATLASIADVVDFLVVNDNSGLERSENVAALESSAFARDGRLQIVRHPFAGFARMRNDAFAPLLSLPRPPQWILFIDADEVHGEQIAEIARDVLPRLGPAVAQLDAYTYHFYGTYRWITDVARRMMFYRFSPELHWVNDVHEKLVGLRGSAVVLPYVYHHYGNVQLPSRYAEKNLVYYEFGNPTPRPPDPEAATLDVYLAKGATVRPFRGAHPLAARGVLDELETENRELFARLDAAFGALQTPAVRRRGALAEFGETLRVRLRSLQHPGLYRGPLSAR
jgi:hypothetical protein